MDHIYDADINIETDEIAQRYLINKGQLKESYDKLNPKGAAKYIIQDIETPVLFNKMFFSVITATKALISKAHMIKARPHY